MYPRALRDRPDSSVRWVRGQGDGIVTLLAALGAGEANTRLLLALVVVIVAVRSVGRLATMLRQPRVLGEIVAGVLLGPSLLGAVAPGVTDHLFATEVLGSIGALAQIGLVLFMFLVGLEVDPGHLRGQARRAVAISHASIVVPFVLGAGLALWLYDDHGSGSRAAFVLFVGIAMSVTAFPVLARVLQEAGLASSRIGSLTLTCAAVDDVTAWCGLAAVVAVTGSSGGSDVLLTVGLTLAVVVAMLGVVRPLLARWGAVPLWVAVALALGSAWVTDAIGVHAIFGAFLAGAVMPAEVGRSSLVERLEGVTEVVLLPMFFVVVGLSTRFGLLDSPRSWSVAALVVAVAVLGKLGGSSVAARLMGESWRDALTIGVLMNTRGLTEIVILTVGRDLGVLDEEMFTVMVVMALTTTAMAGPLLGLLGVRSAGSAPARRVGHPQGRGA